MPEFIKTEALVLNATRWRESSKIVHLFSADHGYVTVIAKGAFRPKSPFRGVLESLSHVEIVYSHRAKRDLQILTSVTLLNAYLNIREDLQKTAVAFSVLELLKKLFRTHEPVSRFFLYVVTLLRSLDENHSVDPKGYLWHFLLKLSQTLGFGWELDYCQHTGDIPNSFPVVLDFISGDVICQRYQKHPSPNDVVLTDAQWKQLKTLAKTKASQLAEISAAGKIFAQPDLIPVFLKHLEYHTEGFLELKSLNWYV